MFEDDDDRQYTVVRNDEEQYSLWPADRALPPGWTAQGVSGTKSACLEHIRTVWTDMRPKGLREFR
ncbi:MbtH family protein [Saccharothrix sp.]|uniref:MbtH family protein n=1 Tax=Saccharothrix sp. TaxID=1873460 RepID=UPI002811FB86|nr:MbtH family protein [Saccharothrix sp.]